MIDLLYELQLDYTVFRNYSRMVWICWKSCGGFNCKLPVYLEFLFHCHKNLFYRKLILRN